MSGLLGCIIQISTVCNFGTVTMTLLNIRLLNVPTEDGQLKRHKSTNPCGSPQVRHGPFDIQGGGGGGA